MSFGAYHRQAVAYYLAQNNLSSLGKINGAILEDITQRAYEAYEAKEKSRKKRGDATPEEIAIYEAYPRHIARNDAIAAIRSVVGMLPSELLDRTKRYANCVRLWPRSYRYPEGRDMVPYPATWFRAGRFGDDPKEWMPAGMHTREDDPRTESSGRTQAEAPSQEPQGWRVVCNTQEAYAQFKDRDWPSIPQFYQRGILKQIR